MPSKNAKGIIIVLDGLDGAGKLTQATRLLSFLQQYTDRVKLLSYPDYDSPSSALVKMYLNGSFSSDPQDINPYAASSFYAVDRYASYCTHWKKYYEAGYILLMNRYVSSNAIHQMPKLPPAEWDNFLHWLDDYEHEKLGLPRPNQIIFLDMPRPVADRLMVSRYQGDASQKDIHENNLPYLSGCTVAADYAAKAQHWAVISCCTGETLLDIDTISSNIIHQTKEVLPFL